MAILQHEKYNFKKGQIIHLDSIYNIQAFVLDYATPYRSKSISKNNWNPDTTDEFKMNKSFTVEIIVKGTT